MAGRNVLKTDQKVSGKAPDKRLSVRRGSGQVDTSGQVKPIARKGASMLDLAVRRTSGHLRTKVLSGVSLPLRGETSGHRNPDVGQSQEIDGAKQCRHLNARKEITCPQQNAAKLGGKSPARNRINLMQQFPAISAGRQKSFEHSSVCKLRTRSSLSGRSRN